MRVYLASVLTGLLISGGVFLAVSVALPSRAEAVVCARGVYRAGCAGPHGAVAVRRAPVAACRYVNGRRVCAVR